MITYTYNKVTREVAPWVEGGGVGTQEAVPSVVGAALGPDEVLLKAGSEVWDAVRAEVVRVPEFLRPAYAWQVAALEARIAALEGAGKSNLT